ncbi:MAG TPA: hypothetical protein VF523_19100, partial [Burkholderiales bacterium]
HVELRTQVVVIEDKFPSERFEQCSDQKKQVRRIASMYDIESTSEKHAYAQSQCPEQGCRVFDCVAFCALAFNRQAIAPYLDAVDLLEPFLVTRSGRADDRNQATGFAQRRRFLPNAAIEWARQILDQYQNPLPRNGALLTVQGPLSAFADSSEDAAQDGCIAPRGDAWPRTIATAIREIFHSAICAGDVRLQRANVAHIPLYQQMPS